MQYRTLGNTGLKVSALCLGAFNFGEPTAQDEAVAMVAAAVDGGITFIDTANVYHQGESERIVGAALKDLGCRDAIVLATKVGGRMGGDTHAKGGARAHIVQSCEDSLRRLQVEAIDLYQLHRPDPAVPQEETLRAFDQLIQQGKVRHIGCSTHPAWVVMEALAISEREGIVRYATEQPPYNLLDRRIENELLPLCQKYGLAVNPWGPLAMGILGGVYPPDGSIPKGSRADRMGGVLPARLTRRALEVGVLVGEMARERGTTPGQLGLLWVKDQPGITAPIMGPETLGQLQDLLPVGDMQLAEEDRPLFDALVPPGNAVSDFHHTNEWMKARIIDPA